jgi:quinol monooxygenase YgiN
MAQVVCVHYRVPKDERDDLLARLAEMATASRAELGCLAYDVHVKEDDHTVIFVYERYADETAQREHRESAHFSQLIGGMPSRWADVKVVEQYTCVEGDQA